MDRRPSSMRMTRRQWTALVGAAPLVAQVPTSNPENQPKKGPARQQSASDVLSKIEVPMNVEPAFSFKA